MTIQSLLLPPVVRALLKARGATRKRVKASDVRATLAQYNVQPSVALMHFEETYGGLVIPDDDADWIFGAHACLSSNAHDVATQIAKRIVPVAYAPNDVAYFLDAYGRGLAQDLIEDPKPTSFARDGRGLVSRIVLNDAQFAMQERHEMEGAQGKKIARALKLTLVKEASVPDARFFTDAKANVIVLELATMGSTIVATNDATLLASWVR